MIALFIVLTLLLLPYHWGFQAGSDELNVLIQARQLIDPTWLPQDWYLSSVTHPPSLFLGLTSGLVARVGGTGAIIVGRLMSYGLLALGLALITHQLRIRLGVSLLAIALWLGFSHLVPIASASRVYFGFAGVTIASLLLVCTGHFPNLKRHYLKLFLLAYGLLLAANDPQSVITGEVLIADFGASSIAYGCLTIAIGLFLRDQRILAALLIGIGTGFQPLIGGYGFLALFVCWLLEDIFLGTLRTKHPWTVCLPFAIGTIGAWPYAWQVWQAQHRLDMTQSSPLTSLATLPKALASEITIFFRYPDQLNAETWYAASWLKLVTYLLVLALSVYTIAVIQRRADLQIDHDFAKRRTLLFVFVCASFFGLGLLLAPHNHTSSWLPYSPFSLFNTLLPLFTLLFFVRALQSIGTLGLTRVGMNGLCWLLIVPIVLRTSLDFAPGLGNPAERLTSGLPTAERDLYAWIQTHTPKEATILAPPHLKGMQWLAQRGTIVTFDFFPSTESGVMAWFDRLNALTQGEAQRQWEAARDHTPQRTAQIRATLVAAYQRLDSTQAIALMKRYEAACVVTTAPINFDRPADYAQEGYWVYCRDNTLPTDLSR